MKNCVLCCMLIGTLALLLGCRKEEKVPKVETVVAKFTATPIILDGKLEDAAWKNASAYKMTGALDRWKEPRPLTEGGEARFAWDDNFFYVGIQFTDSDIVAEGEEDQLHHYRMGDLVELFIKPAEQTWYWELYATPKSKKTSFWFPGRGRLGLESCYQYKCGLQVAAQCDGTLNNWEDKDKEWCAEMAMPIADLTARGEKFLPESKWRILVSRYNYSRYVPWVELSAIGPLPRPSYHIYERYAVLKLVK